MWDCLQITVNQKLIRTNETLYDRLDKKLGQSSSTLQTNKTRHAGMGSNPALKDRDVCRTMKRL